MNFRNISAWSIRNPVVPIVIFVGLMIAGLVSFSTMKVQNDPDIEFPAVIVAISQPGAAPSEIESQITQKVESAVRSISGVDTINFWSLTLVVVIKYLTFIMRADNQGEGGIMALISLIAVAAASGFDPGTSAI